MNYTWFLVLSAGIFPPALVGLIRYRRIAPGFRPLLLFLWVGALNEIISIMLPRHGHSTAVNNNIYVLLEAALLLWQLERWNAFGRWHRLFPLLLTLFAVLWTLENFIFSSLAETLPWFRLLYSFVLVIAAIQVINRLIIYEHRSLLRHPVFLVCTGVIVYFTYKGLIEVFWINGIDSSPVFLTNVFAVHAWINFLANGIYLIAVLWMPSKQRFIFPC